jgi:hypothetical protein
MVFKLHFATFHSMYLFGNHVNGETNEINSYYWCAMG